jgi:hypothetical protein
MGREPDKNIDTTPEPRRNSITLTLRTEMLLWGRAERRQKEPQREKGTSILEGTPKRERYLYIRRNPKERQAPLY